MLILKNSPASCMFSCKKTLAINVKNKTLFFMIEKSSHIELNEEAVTTRI